MKQLLDAGADVNAQAKHRSALQVASESGHEQIVRLLLERGALADNNAIQAASAGGHEQIVRLLLEQKV